MVVQGHPRSLISVPVETRNQFPVSEQRIATYFSCCTVSKNDIAVFTFSAVKNKSPNPILAEIGDVLYRSIGGRCWKLGSKDSVDIGCVFVQLLSKRLHDRVGQTDNLQWHNALSATCRSRGIKRI